MSKKKSRHKPWTLWRAVKTIALVLVSIFMLLGIIAVARHYWQHHFK